MNPDKTYTYDPKLWTMDTIDDSAKSKVIVNAVPELPFFWFVNPWLTVQQLADERARLVKQCNDLRADMAVLDDHVYDLQNELETVKAERDAANDAVRTLRKKGKRRG
jgi:cell division protein FtsB